MSRGLSKSTGRTVAGGVPTRPAFAIILDNRIVTVGVQPVIIKPL